MVSDAIVAPYLVVVVTDARYYSDLSRNVFRLSAAQPDGPARRLGALDAPVVHLGARRLLRLEFARKCFVRAVSCTTPSKLIYRGIAERSVESRNDGLVSWGLLWACDDFGERILQDVLGQRAVSDSISLAFQRAISCEGVRTGEFSTAMGEIPQVPLSG